MAQIIKAGGSGGGKPKKRTTPWDTGAAPVAYDPSYGAQNRIDAMSDDEYDAFEQWTGAFAPKRPAPRGPGGPGDGGGSAGGDPYASVRDQIMSQYESGQADLLRSALGGRNSIGDAGSSFQKAMSSLGQDARREGNLAGKNMQDSLSALLRSHDSGMARSVGDLERQGFDDPRLRALMSENGTSIRRQGTTNRNYQDRLMEVFDQDFNARQQGGKMITEGALSQLANVQHMQQGQLDAQKQKALSDLVMQEAAARARARSGDGSGSRGASGSTGYIDEQGIFHQGVGFSKDMEYADGVDPDLIGSLSKNSEAILGRMSKERQGKARGQLDMLQRRVDAGEDWEDLRHRFSVSGNDKELNGLVYDYFRPYANAKQTRTRRNGLIRNSPTGTKG